MFLTHDLLFKNGQVTVHVVRSSLVNELVKLLWYRTPTGSLVWLQLTNQMAITPFEQSHCRAVASYLKVLWPKFIHTAHST